MRLPVFITILSTFFFLQTVLCTEEQMNQVVGLAKITCKSKLKLSDDQINSLGNDNWPEDRELKCFSNCLLELLNIMKRGKISYDNVIKQIDLMVPENHKDNLKNTITTCRNEHSGAKDLCDSGFEVLKCLEKNSPHFLL